MKKKLVSTLGALLGMVGSAGATPLYSSPLDAGVGAPPYQAVLCSAVNTTSRPQAVTVTVLTTTGAGIEQSCPVLAPGAACENLLAPVSHRSYHCRVEVGGSRRSVKASFRLLDPDRATLISVPVE